MLHQGADTLRCETRAALSESRAAAAEALRCVEHQQARMRQMTCRAQQVCEFGSEREIVGMKQSLQQQLPAVTRPQPASTDFSHWTPTSLLERFVLPPKQQQSTEVMCFSPDVDVSTRDLLQHKVFSASSKQQCTRTEQKDKIWIQTAMRVQLCAQWHSSALAHLGGTGPHPGPVQHAPIKPGQFYLCSEDTAEKLRRLYGALPTQRLSKSRYMYDSWED